ncbi:MAG: Smr/MutS family protein [Gemmatimonadota bacterium]
MRDEASAEARTLRLLEWGPILDLIAGHATSEEGRAHLRRLLPWREAARIDEALRTTDEMVGLLLRGEWSPPPIPEARAALRRLAVSGSVLEPRELIAVSALLASSRRARADLRRAPDELPRLAAIGRRLLKDAELERRLGEAFDESGGVADSASPDLRRIRRSLRSARASVVRRLETFIRSLPARIQVPDGSVTVRSGRYCVPIRREGRSEVGGIVHDESATHRTVFVEPPVAIEPMNRLAELEREEAREVERVLRALTAAARPRAGALEASLDALAETDSLYARARWALGHGGVRPEVVDPLEPAGAAIRLVSAHHPLLLATGEPSVPFNLGLAAGETVLLVSGPNAGGKTVLLKTIGVASLLAQAGAIPPVGPGTRLPMFRRFFAVIGDEQSIAASLSSFSAQVVSLRDALSRAGPASLVLLDEIGGNTDPAEGAALAAAVLLRLAGQARLTVATTHLGALKALAAEDERIVNASLQFDTAALRPTFRLLRDRPGRSYALEIATRLGLPEDVLSEARARLGEEDRRTEALLAELERREVELERLTEDARLRDRRSREGEERAVEAERRIVAREKALEREGRARAERYLKEARRDVAAEIERLREAFEGAAEGQGAGARETAAEAAATARSRVEQRLRDARSSTGPDEPGQEPSPEGVVTGARVRSRSLGLTGRLGERRGDRALLEAGEVRIEVPFEDLEPAGTDEGRGGKGEGRRPRGSDRALPDLPVRTEIDLRGLRVEEVSAALQAAVDAAVVADLPFLRVIHGKGTFAVRDEVQKLLGSDGRILRLRPGGFEEGGAGVTVVEFTGGGD